VVDQPTVPSLDGIPWTQHRRHSSTIAVGDGRELETVKHRIRGCVDGKRKRARVKKGVRGRRGVGDARDDGARRDRTRRRRRVGVRNRKTDVGGRRNRARDEGDGGEEDV